MAKTFLEVLNPFTRSIAGETVVGHPKHPDPLGRFVSPTDGAEVDELVVGGFAKRITEEAYLKGTQGTELVTAGETRLAQTAGEFPKANATWTNARIIEEAARREVSLASAKGDRHKMISLLNAATEKGQGTGPTEGAEGVDTREAQMSGLTNDSTLHPSRISPQNDVGSSGTVDKLFDGTAHPNGQQTGLEAGDAAPTDGEGLSPQGGSGTAGA
jgi:hypothetical protein